MCGHTGEDFRETARANGISEDVIQDIYRAAYDEYKNAPGDELIDDLIWRISEDVDCSNIPHEEQMKEWFDEWCLCVANCVADEIEEEEEIDEAIFD